MRSEENYGSLEDRLIRWFPLWIVALGILAYAGSFTCTFIFDDYGMIYRIRHVDGLWPVSRLFSGTRRWVVDLTFYLNHIFGRLNPADFHIVNLLIHILAALTLYGLVRRTLELAGRHSDRVGRGLAGFIAAIWIVHPLNTQSVTYISQRFESMMGLFYLLVLYCLARTGSSSRPAAWYGLSILILIVGAGTKEVIVTAPVMMLLYDHVFLSGKFRHFLWRRGIVLLSILSGLLLVGRSLWWPALKGVRAGIHSASGMSPLDYGLTQAGVLLHYIRLSVLPYPLCFDYGWPPAQNLSGVWLPGLAILSGLAWAAWAAIFRRSAIGFLWAAFFVILAPTSSLLPLQDLAAEHRMYLPLAAVLTFLIVGGACVCSSIATVSARPAVGWGRTVCLGMPSLVVLVFLGLTVSRNRVYSSEETLWRDVVEKRPDNLRAYPNLATTLLRQRRFAEAAACARELLARAPDYSGMESKEIQRVAVGEIDPNLHFAPVYCAHAFNVLGIHALEQNDTEEAIRVFMEAIRIKPGFIDPYSNMGTAFLRKGDISQADYWWSTLLKMAPRHAAGLSNLAMIRLKQERFDEARDLLERALAEDPYQAFLRYQLAWLLATCPDDAVRDGVKALTLAEALYRETSGKNHPDLLDLLSVAYAECLRFGDAIEAVKKAIQSTDPFINTTGSRGDDLSGWRERLKLYESGMPYRMPKKRETVH